MLPNNFRKRVLIIASKDDANCSQIIQNYDKANATIFSHKEFEATEIKENKYDSISIFSSESVDYNFKFLSIENFLKCFSSIRLGGYLSIQCALNSNNEQYEKFIKDLEKDCMYAGFVDVEISCNKNENNEYLCVKLLCNKPEWSSSEIVTSKVDGDEEFEMVDETLLIDANEKYEKMGEGKEGCSTKPRACANCTCGRKEREEGEDKDERKKNLEDGVIRSSCGNCYLGDAYRCKDCPYAGLPAFRPGDKVELDMQKNNLAENTNQSTSGNEIGVTLDGKIKLKV